MKKWLKRKLTPTAALFDIRDLRCCVKIEENGKWVCWRWLGGLNERGYGKVERKWKGKLYVRAHRLAYVVLVGDIPSGLTIEHKCKNRACVNPAHLEPMTLEQNLARRSWRGRDERQQTLFNERASI